MMHLRFGRRRGLDCQVVWNEKTFQLQLDALGALICFVVALAYLFWPCHTSIAGYIQDVLKGASR
jgi:hypothetical protein